VVLRCHLTNERSTDSRPIQDKNCVSQSMGRTKRRVSVPHRHEEPNEIRFEVVVIVRSLIADKKIAHSDTERNFGGVTASLVEEMTENHLDVKSDEA
jgi:hypothetical protein